MHSPARSARCAVISSAIRQAAWPRWDGQRAGVDGLSNRASAQRLGVSERAIRKLIGSSTSVQAEQLDLAAITSAATGELPQAAVPCAKSSTAEATRHPGPSLANAQADELDNASAEDEPVPLSVDRDASDRTFDRQLAYLGLLDDAAPLFRDGSQVPGVGVLLAIPALMESGLLRLSRKLYGEIGPAFYGLRTTLLTLLLMALLRIQPSRASQGARPGRVRQGARAGSGA